jgi:hypothetical protein
MRHMTQELVSAYHSSKLTQKAFCKERSIPLSTLHYHLQKYKKNKTAADGLPLRPRFVPIVPQLPVKRSSTIIIKADLNIPELIALIETMGA